MLSDMVTDTSTVQQMQGVVRELADDRSKIEANIVVQLKTPINKKHWFIMNAFKTVNEFGLTNKIYLTFTDLGEQLPESEKALIKG